VLPGRRSTYHNVEQQPQCADEAADGRRQPDAIKGPQLSYRGLLRRLAAGCVTVGLVRLRSLGRAALVL
jgi:hypothetical protein